MREAGRLDWWTTNATDVGTRIRALCGMLDDIGLTVSFHLIHVVLSLLIRLKYVIPGAAWFVFVSVGNILLSEEYNYPPLVAKHGTKDWKTRFFLVQEFGIASIPGTCFYEEDNKALGARYLRFGACKSDEGLQLAAVRL